MLCDKKFFKYAILFFIGGLLYILIEDIWRGYSHFSMFFLGGICFLLCGGVNECCCQRNLALSKQAFICMLLITTAELLVGYILNIKLHLHIWDYSDLPFNFIGQICVPYTILWYFLSIPAIILDDWIRWKLFCGEKREYHVF